MDKIVKVAIPIALDKEFDYLLPSSLNAEPGIRVLVDFNGKKRVAVVCSLSRTSEVKKIKTVIDVLDSKPSLSQVHISFAKKLSEVYSYPKGEFIFMMLPTYLRKTHRLDLGEIRPYLKAKTLVQKVFIKADTFLERYRMWRDGANEKLKTGSVLVIFPQLTYLEAAHQIIKSDFSCPVHVFHSKQREKDIFSAWKESRENSLILGTRMALFYYPRDLELIIIEEENSRYYSQEEKPFYHLPDVAFMLSKAKNADLFYSGNLPSLVSYKYIKEKKIILQEQAAPNKEIQIVAASALSHKKLISPVLIEILKKTIQENKKGVVLWNRKGLGRFVSCSSCGHIFTCMHCSCFLQLLPSLNEGICSYCHRKVALPSICNYCHKGYLKTSGYGIERIGAILKRIFPEAKIDTWERHKFDSQIILSTSEILTYLYGAENFDNGFMLDIDAFLVRMNYDATFNAYLYLKALLRLFKDKLYVFTKNKDYYFFQYLNKPWRDFYEVELGLRRRLNLPPYGTVIKITLRAKNENLLFKKASDLYNILGKRYSEVHGPFKDEPFKLRDKFRYALIIKVKKGLAFRKAIKEELGTFRSSSVQLAVNIR